MSKQLFKSTAVVGGTAARGDLDSLTRTQLRRGWKYTAVVIPWHEQIVAKTRRSLLLVLGAVGFLLMIVCVNVANLLLSRGAGRGQEIAVRRAMGAGRTRIIRQPLTESVLMSVMGGTLGLALARVCKDLLLAFISPNLPTLAPIALDYGVLLFSLGIVVLTGIGFGLAPALQASGMAVNGVP